jgi:hypothetical protein
MQSVFHKGISARGFSEYEAKTGAMPSFFLTPWVNIFCAFVDSERGIVGREGGSYVYEKKNLCVACVHPTACLHRGR